MVRRKKPLPPGLFPAEILDLDQQGRGFARPAGKATFIADALPGEQVRFRYTQVSKDADDGQCMMVDEASEHRVVPACEHFGLCGGCSMQHLAPEQQIVFKQKQMLDQLGRIGKVQADTVAPPVVGAEPTDVWGYRRRARLGVKHVPKRGGVLVGFRERESGLIASLSSCKVLDARVGEKLHLLAEVIQSLSIRDAVPQIELAAANRVGLVFRVLETPTDEDREKLRGFAEREGFDIYLQPGGLDSIQLLDPETAEARVLQYSPDGSELQLRFRPADFIQINGNISQQTVNQALDWLEISAGDRVLELFCGLGNFSLPLARRGAQVIAVEGEQGLVDRARENAARNGLEIRFEKADLFKTAADASWLQPPFDKVLLDPPRAGAKEILPLIAARKPRRIVYVSCHPGTLARDAGMLVHEYGYRLVRAGVMDMFPHTSHVESMALFVRED
jgi:23S rRNA (uracil1939-C5)-methyltransferase